MANGLRTRETPCTTSEDYLVVIDSSAVVAILRYESDALDLLAVLGEAESRRMSAATYLEVAIVVDATQNRELIGRFESLLLESGVTIEPVTSEQAQTARLAYQRYGRGSGSPARLNFGDCFAYALARATGEPLLFKGDDFVHTDVVAAIAR